MCAINFTVAQLFAIAAGVSFSVICAISLIIIVFLNIDNLRNPVNNKLEFDDWFVRQFISLFNRQCGNRWYESRAHLRRGVFVSLLCAFSLIDIVRYEFETGEYGRFVTGAKFYLGFRSYRALLKKVISDKNKVQSSIKEAQYFSQVFIAGHNVAYSIYDEN
jgi:hypothetical protein